MPYRYFLESMNNRAGSYANWVTTRSSKPPAISRASTQCRRSTAPALQMARSRREPVTVLLAGQDAATAGASATVSTVLSASASRLEPGSTVSLLSITQILGMSRISVSRIRQREMPRWCPAAFLARIILPHQEVADVHKSQISSTPND